MTVSKYIPTSKCIPTSVEVQFDGDEPYISPPSHPDIRITAHRNTDEDLDGMVRVSNDPETGKWSGRNFPFEKVNAVRCFQQMYAAQAEGAAALRADPRARVKQSPFSVIRDANGRFIGDIFVNPADPNEHGPDPSVCLPKLERLAPDSAVWDVAYSLDPAYRGRGIMAAAVGAVISWARTGLAAGEFNAWVEPANKASEAMVRKLGMELKMSIPVTPYPAGGPPNDYNVWALKL